MTATGHKSDLLTLLGLFIGHLCQITEVVALHLQIKDFAFHVFGVGDQIIIQEFLQVKVSNISPQM